MPPPLYDVQVAWPITGAMLMRRSVDLISVVFVGHIGREYLAGVGLATVTANVTGYSMLIGLTGGLSTQAGIAKGARDVPALVLAFQRCVLIAACACIPITLLWLHAYPIITYLGQVIHMFIIRPHTPCFTCSAGPLTPHLLLLLCLLLLCLLLLRPPSRKKLLRQPQPTS